MNRNLSLVLAALVAGLLLLTTTPLWSQPGNRLPPRVDQRAWVPLSNRAGIALGDSRGFVRRGRLWVRDENNVWRPVDLASSPIALPLK